jgi:hypothetical protein
MLDVSPTKWHLAHTSWFFETFVLAHHSPDYASPNPRYAFLFNSYYVQAGERHCRAQRGLVTRPSVREVFEYREHVDEAMHRRAHRRRPAPGVAGHRVRHHHEQQHQGAAHRHQARVLDQPLRRHTRTGWSLVLT